MKKKIVFSGGLIIVLILTFILGIKFGMMRIDATAPLVNCKPTENIINEKIDNIDIKYSNNIKYYVKKGDYDGDYDYQKVSFSEDYQNREAAMNKINDYNNHGLFTFDEYDAFCKKWNLNQKYNDKTKKYMIISYAEYESTNIDASLANVVMKDGKVTVYLWEHTDGVSADIKGYFIAIPVDEEIYQNEIVMTLTKEEYQDMENNNRIPDATVKKPIIYLYPTKETKVNVSLGNTEALITSYPKYNASWKVIASPDGNLKDVKTNKNYYGLYYESTKKNLTMKEDGFVVSGKDSIAFLEEKLDILGLNERETNEFIIYWLPILEANKYNYIRFETDKEINDYMPLDITPKPDTMIRVIMDYKPLNENIKVKKQILTQKKRNGFTVVEWGANEIK